MHLVLASRSPRRSDLLTRAGHRFEVAPADIDERRLDGEAPAALVRRLARGKAAAVAPRHPGAIVLGADTVVVVDGAVLGKPAGDADAAAMLRRLSGRAHEVLTGVAVRTDGRRCDGVQSTRVGLSGAQPGRHRVVRGDRRAVRQGRRVFDPGAGVAVRHPSRGLLYERRRLPIELVDDLLAELRADRGRGADRAAGAASPGGADR